MEEQSQDTFVKLWAKSLLYCTCAAVKTFCTIYTLGKKHSVLFVHKILTFLIDMSEIQHQNRAFQQEVGTCDSAALIFIYNIITFVLQVKWFCHHVNVHIRV